MVKKKINILQKNKVLKSMKKDRIKINNLYEFRDALKKEGYDINEADEEGFREQIAEIFKLDRSVEYRLNSCINNNEITYKVNDVQDFIDYVEKLVLFEEEHNKLCEKISHVKKLYIDRIEYEREVGHKENIEHIIKNIEKTKSNVCRVISEKEEEKLRYLEKEIDKHYIYAKDIELLKKMILINKPDIKEKYNAETRTKTIFIELPEKINYNYIKPKEGTVEYHDHLNNNIPRIQRLRKNISKYMKVDEKEKNVFKIDQSKTLQDSINIALAIYDNKEFKAISGSNDIEDYCTAPPLKEAKFKSNKVNKLGKLGTGYNRVNDSEKKIFEEIHKQIESKELKNEGKLILYSKWEPCPSCYFVISQFCKEHPKINVEVKYSKTYGE
ncbi:MAG: hypothetical protein E7208_10280 [Clostridium butyricum]|nr:hypothetical protein [Clostridium butyricum]